MGAIAFKEIQKFNQWWLWALMSAMPLIPLYGIYKQVVLGTPWGDRPMSNNALYIFLGFTLLVLGLLSIIKLTTEIDDEGIEMSFFPFTRKHIKWSEIKSAQVVDYGFVGGWGIRVGTKYGTVYNTSGSIGLAMVMSDGTKLCIGTQQEQALVQVIKNIDQ